MTTRAELMQLRSMDFRVGGLPLPSPEEVMEWFSVLEAGWVHNGDPAKPHAILHAGDHSSGFFLCKRVLGYGSLREILAMCIIAELRKVWLGDVDGVFGSPYSSLGLAFDIGRLLRTKTYVPEKGLEKGAMVFKPDDPVPAGALLLQVEELVTTWDSGKTTAQAIVDGNPNPVKFAPFVGVLVHRPRVLDRALLNGRTLVPFIERQVDAWKPADCPLCKQGSRAVFPKTQWAELTA